jgi:hypothetical protein
MTVSATVFKANSFETGEAGTGWTFDGTKNWDSSGVRVGGDASLDGYTASRPMTGVTSNTVLKLDTEGSVWTNAVVGGGIPTSGDKVFTDMLVKFVPSEELPFINGLDVKLAVAVLAGTPNKLAISVIDPDNYNTNVWFVTGAAIDTNVWTRLTIEMFNDTQFIFANVKTNGALVNASPYYVNAADKTLNSIGFSGTGFIDEVVVRSDDPIQTAILLTLNFAAGIDSVYVGGTAKTTGQTVTSPAELVITASQWKEIASLTGPNTITWVDGGLGSSVATVTVANASATTVEIAGQTSTSSTAIGGQTYFNGQQLSKVATWALANGVTTLSNDIYDQYLFNIPTDGVPVLLITSMSVVDTTVSVSVLSTNNVNFASGINGTLKIKAYPVLGGTPEVYTGFVGTTNAVFTTDIGTNKFIKASVE